jgi:hypothetical protein
MRNIFNIIRRINPTTAFRIIQIGCLLWIGYGVNRTENAVYDIDTNYKLESISNNLEDIHQAIKDLEIQIIAK